MALANFFDKINLGAAQILKDHDRSAFENKLLSNCIVIYFNTNSLQNYECRIALDLLTRLLSRLYPKVKFKSTETTEESIDYIGQLKAIAIEINPKIEVGDEQEETFFIGVGIVPDSSGYFPTHYIGSSNWNTFHSTTTPQNFGSSQNPFGAAVAACLACANLFRRIFADELGNPLLDEDLSFSTFDQMINPSDCGPKLPAEIPLNFTLIGAGAIGNATLYSFLRLSNTKGRISLIDKEEFSLSNLQRYVLMMQGHEGQSKVGVIREIFKNQKSELTIDCYPSKWQEVMGSLQPDQLKLFATAIDTKYERQLLQSVLPKKIINAWTSPDCIGISRHFDFLNEICLSCLYFPSMKEKSESQKIAIALNMEQHEPFIRHYLAKNMPIDEQFIATVNQMGGIEVEKLRLFANQPVRVLYSEGICGGAIVSLNNKDQVAQDMEVPLAHESAFAGILLAAEIVIDSLKLRTRQIEPLTKINLMRPLHAYLRENEEKNFSGRCICQDGIFKNRYKEKWS